MAMSRQAMVSASATRAATRLLALAQDERGADEEEARRGVGLHAAGQDGAGAHVLDDHEGAAEHDGPAAQRGGEARAQPQRRAGDDERQAGVELHDEVAGERAVEVGVVEHPRREDERADGADDDAADARRQAEARAQLRHVGHGNTVAASYVEDTMTNGDAIAIRGVTKRFGDYAAVDDLTLTVPRGSIYGFIGPNGSGKTTTLRMIMNILLPDAGEIEVLGERTTHAARDRVGYLPEERGLYKKMTVRDLLRYYGRLKGAARASSTGRSTRGSSAAARGSRRAQHRGALEGHVAEGAVHRRGRRRSRSS